MVGVVGTTRTGGEDEIVAGAFALGAQPLRREPHQRVEPVGGARQVRQHLRHAVTALHMRKLMEQDDALAVERPVFSFGRQQHVRAHQSPRHRHRILVSGEERDVSIDAERSREVMTKRHPDRRRRRTPRDPPHACRTKREPCEHEQHTSEPDRRRCREWVG